MGPLNRFRPSLANAVARLQQLRDWLYSRLCELHTTHTHSSTNVYTSRT